VYRFPLLHNLLARRDGALMAHACSQPPKNTFGEMRAARRGQASLAYCSDYHCGRWGKLDADRWPDHSTIT
jgi:hypothetical protein